MAHSTITSGGTINMAPGAPIVTISFGEERVFRLSRRQPARRERLDFTAFHGSVLIMPYATNLVWKHEVPHFARYSGRGISLTLRAFLHGTADTKRSAVSSLLPVESANNR